MHHSRRRTSTGKAKRPARRDKPEPIVFDPDGDLMLNLYGSACMLLQILVVPQANMINSPSSWRVRFGDY